MLMLRESAEGLVWYESPLLREIGVRHAFSTRRGGASSAPFASLNMGNPSGSAQQDARANILENERRMIRAAGMRPDSMELCRVHQVHGAMVADARRGRVHDGHQQADAIVSDDPSRVVSVRVADCVPVLLASENGGTVAAIHAGWRGVAAGIVPIAAAMLGGAVRAAIGPGIGQDAFEVGPEVADEFARTFERSHSALTFLRRGRADRWHVDLQAAIVDQLTRIGCDRIDTTDRCTHRDADDFFSHRRDNGVTGRMAAFIAAGRGV